MIDQQHPPRKLRAWFWLALLAPALLATIANAIVFTTIHGEAQLGWMIGISLFAVLPLTGICSACCAVHLSRVRTGRVHAAWVVAGMFGFFALNLALAFGGCALGA